MVLESSTSTASELNFSNQYTYDLTGNRLKKSSLGVSPENIDYTYNDNDQLITETSNTKGGLTYDYDANGSLISKTGQNATYTYTYNLQNRLATADIQRTENGGSVSIQSNYVYNQSGIRVRANNTVNSITQNRIFLLDAGLTGYSQVLEEFDAIGGVPVISYTLGDDIISQASIQNSSLITHHFLYDGHGSTRLLTDNTSTVTDTYNYDAYGIQLGPTSNITNRATTDLLYSGEQFDNELQMQYLRARYYDQNNGTFNRLDPLTGNSLYIYCSGDPVNNSDPTGMYEIDVHQFLTIYLARAAGFNNNTATKIGLATQKLDHPKDSRNAMNSTFSMWKYHFPSRSSMYELEKAVTADSYNFTKVGEFIHALQDTYGHSTGVGDRTWEYYGDFLMFKSGGLLGHAFQGHRPDHTWRDVAKAMKMAKKIHTALRLIALRTNATGTVQRFTAIENTVRNFLKYEPSLYTQYYGGLYAVESVSTSGYEAKIKLLDPQFKLPGYAQKEYMSKSQHITDKINSASYSFMNQLQSFFFNIEYY